MKWIALLMTIAIWQCVRVTGNVGLVNFRKSRINPMIPLVPHMNPSYMNGEVVNPFLPFYTGFGRATKKKPEDTAKNDEEDKPTSQIQKREINKPELTESGNKNLDVAVDYRNIMSINNNITHKNTQENTTESENGNKNDEKEYKNLFFKLFFKLKPICSSPYMFNGRTE